MEQMKNQVEKQKAALKGGFFVPRTGLEPAQACAH